MKLQFLGGAGTVTGSRTLVTAGHTTLLVDCGLFQGFKDLRLRNWERFPVPPEHIDAVVLTHAHLDHSGWIPRLIKEGFRGPVYASASTRALARLLLLDSGYLQEEDAAHANRHGWSKHRPALPLYTKAEAEASLAYFEDVAWDDPFQVGDLELRLRPAGHILGASLVRVDDGHHSVLFSGDLGRANDLVMRPPADPPACDALVLESTYGNRDHPSTDAVEQIAEVVRRTTERGGVLLIPAFAVGRTQALLRALQILKERREIPDVPVYLDSPMATNCTELYVQHSDEHRLSAEEAKGLWEHVHLVPTPDDSKRVDHQKGPMVVISASGMLTGGRVLHHLAAFARNKRNTLLFSGYQAAGTRGASILDGAREVKVHGKVVPIECEVARIDAMSAHADRGEILDWLHRFERPPGRVWLNHGEPAASDALRQKIQRELGWDVVVAREGQVYDLGTIAPVPAPPVEVAKDRAALVADVIASPTYRRADLDPQLLQRDDLRAARLMLEYLKVEQGLKEHQVDATVVVFGGTRLSEPEGRWYREARAFARLASAAPLHDHAQVLVMTGGGPGIMDAANRGATDAGQPSIGLNISLPSDQEPNPWVTPELAFKLRYFAIRKMHFLRRAQALVAFPGGWGTLDELFDALTLIQTGKMPPVPVVLVGREHWGQAVDFDFLVREGLVAPEHMHLLEFADSAEEAWQIVRDFYQARGHRGPWDE